MSTAIGAGQGAPYVVTELMSGGEVEGELAKADGTLPLVHAWEIAPGFASDVSLTSVRASGGTVVGAGAAAVLIGAGEHTLRVRAIEQAAHACAASGDRVFIATARGVEVLGPGDSRALRASIGVVPTGIRRRQR